LDSQDQENKKDSLKVAVETNAQSQAVNTALQDLKDPHIPPEIAQLAADYSVCTVTDVWDECRRYLGYDLCPGATDQEIKEVESKCGFPLPAELKDLLKYTNGPDLPQKERGLRVISTKKLMKRARIEEMGAKVITLYKCKEFTLIMDAETEFWLELYLPHWRTWRKTGFRWFRLKYTTHNASPHMVLGDSSCLNVIVQQHQKENAKNAECSRTSWAKSESSKTRHSHGHTAFTTDTERYKISSGTMIVHYLNNMLPPTYVICCRNRLEPGARKSVRT